MPIIVLSVLSVELIAVQIFQCGKGLGTANLIVSVFCVGVHDQYISGVNGHTLQICEGNYVAAAFQTVGIGRQGAILRGFQGVIGVDRLQGNGVGEKCLRFTGVQQCGQGLLLLQVQIPYGVSAAICFC